MERSVAGAPPRAGGPWLWAAAGLSLAISLTPWGDLLLYPFALFTTWVHECSHALAALALGGSVQSITIRLDGSGLAESLVPGGRLSQGLVTSAGYLGASLVGCVLMAAARVQRLTRAILWAIGACMLVTLVLWVRNFSGALLVLACAAVLLFLSHWSGGTTSRFVLSLLAIQVALNAVFDIRVLFLAHAGPSDAETMASLFWLPSWLWAGVWMFMSVGMLGWTLWVTRARGSAGNPRSTVPRL